MEKTAKSSNDLCDRRISWKQALFSGGKAGAGPSGGIKRSGPSDSAPEPTSLPPSSAPTENPPPPEQVSPTPEEPLAEASAPGFDESTWPALDEWPEKTPSTPKHPAGGVSAVKKAPKVPDASPVVIDNPTERGSSSRDPNPVSDQSERRGSSRRGNSSRNSRHNASNRRGSQRNNTIMPAAPMVPSARGTNVPLPMRPRGIGHGNVRSTPFGNLPLLPPPPMRPFGAPLFRPYRAPPFMPFIPPVRAGYNPAMSFLHRPPPVRRPAIHHPALLLHGNDIRAAIVQQIDYYFSAENLVRDEFLRSKMDDEGWVPVSLIASFPRVRRLTDSIPLILDSLRASYVVEVQNNKVRKRHGWRQWLTRSLPRSSCSTPVPGG